MTRAPRLQAGTPLAPLGALLASLAVLVGCSSEPSGSGAPLEKVAAARAELSWGDNDPLGWPAPEIVATNSVEVRAFAVVAADIAVTRAATGPVLSNSAELSLISGAQVQGNVWADTLYMGWDANLQGQASYNQKTGAGAFHGISHQPLTLPLAMTLPPIPTATAGQTNVAVPQTTQMTLAAGAYGDVDVRNGNSSTTKTRLWLSGGDYVFRSLNVRWNAILGCTARCRIVVTNGVTLHTDAALLPNFTHGAPADVELIALGTNGGTGAPDGTPAVLDVASNARLNAFVHAPNGTVEIRAYAQFAGKIVARDVRIISNSQLAGCAAVDATCDGVDDDCNGQVDEDFVPTPLTCGVGACARAGQTVCTNGAVVNACQPGTAAPSDASCNGVDDDCNGQVDEDFVPTNETCGVGSCSGSAPNACVSGQVVSGCVPGTPAGGDATCNGADDDCDGQVDEDFVPTATSCGVGACQRAGQTSCQEGAVVDSCAAGTPGAADPCNGIDDDCDGQVDEDFVGGPTSCGVGACARTGTAACVGGQVVDSCSAGTPSGSDAVCDGVDNDCDGQVDEDFVPTATSCGVGECASTGQLTCVAGQPVNTCEAGTPAASDVLCNGFDDDCDGQVDEDFVSEATECGVGSCRATGQTYCEDGVESDSCQEGSSAADDATCDGVDNDCDGQVDEDYVPLGTSCGTGACGATGQKSCQNGQEVDSCQAGTPAANDASCNGVDDDCDGATDEDFVVEATSCGVGACGNVGTRSCQAGVVRDSCAPGQPAANDATCDGIDDDCDGQVDENYASQPIQCGTGACERAGTRACSAGHVVDSCTPGTAAAFDATCDNVDDDCDGQADEDYVQVPTTCGVGACGSTGTTSCSGGVTSNSCAPGTAAPSDATCNGVDDDCDGATDEDVVDVPTTCGVGSCSRSGTSSCVGGAWRDSCAPGTPSVGDFLCDGEDEDCDGSVDEDYVETPTSCGVGACVRDGQVQCEAGVEVSSCVPGSAAPSDATCDGLDDDCDGATDEDYAATATTCGQGVCAATGSLECFSGVVQNTCEVGSPTSLDAECDGVDNDCDGQIDEHYVTVASSCGAGACRADGLVSCVAGELVDSCEASGSGGVDDVCDGFDSDCDGEIDEHFTPVATSCGVGACARTGQTTCTAGAIGNSCVPGTAASSDASCNQIDDDCDGFVDEDYAPTPTSCGVGACARTGQLTCGATGVVDSCTVGAPAEFDATCNGVDDDCDGQIDEDFVGEMISCGLGACRATTTTSCVDGAIVSECEAGTPAANDASCNGVDDDCNGEIDEDYAPVATSCGVGACSRTGTTSCESGSVVTECEAGTPASNDASCNGVDDDCNGEVDEDYAPVATSCGVGACSRTGTTSCESGSVVTECEAGTPASNDASCNGVDDDCNGEVDEDYAPVATSCGVGACSRTGTTSCESGSVVTECEAGTPASNDASCNGVDDDCNGEVDEDYAPVATSCGVGACSRTGTTSCESGSVVTECEAGTPASNDASCNGVDDDCNGEIDEDYVGSTVHCGVGACRRQGSGVCEGGVVVEECTEGFPGLDDASCNGVDDDCDGQTDEDFSGASVSCGVGACARVGNEVCRGGAIEEECSPGSAASSDANCDGVDDDCNGQADEDFVVTCSGDAVARCEGGSLRLDACGDGDVCNGVESCSAASCHAGTPPSTDDGDPCTVGSCDATLGVRQTPAPLGTSCGSGTVCDGAGHCLAPPHITREPVDLDVSPGQPYFFVVEATGTGLVYQWLRDGEEIPGARGAVLSAPLASGADDGSAFSVRVENAAGSVTSRGALLSVGDADGPELTIAGAETGLITIGVDRIVLRGVAEDVGSGVVSVVVTSARLPALSLAAPRQPDGSFEIEVPLAVGDNLLSVRATDGEGNTTDRSVVVRYQVSDVPALTLLSPLPGSFVSTATVDVSGLVRSTLAAEQLRVRLGSTVVYPTGASGEYAFTFENVALQPGENVLSFVTETPTGAVTHRFVIVRAGTDVPTTGNAPRISLPGVQPDSVRASLDYSFSGLVEADTCVSLVQVNGVAVPVSGSGNRVSFGATLGLSPDGAPLSVEVRAVDCAGRVGVSTHSVRYDGEGPVLQLSIAEAPEVVEVSESPILIRGTVQDPHLAGVSVQSQSLSAVPIGSGTYEFSFEVPLVAGQERELTIAAWDRAGARTEKRIILRLTSTVVIELLTPTNGQEIVSLEDPVGIPVRVRVPGLHSSDRVLAQAGGAPVELGGGSGGVYSGTVRVPLVTGSVQLVVQARATDGSLRAQTSATLRLQDAEDLEIEVAQVFPERGAVDVEPFQFVQMSLNRPVHPEDLSCEVRETARVKQYKAQPQAADLFTLGKLEIEEIRRTDELVPGGLSILPGERTFAFYPRRPYAYTGQLTIACRHEDEEFFRSEFRVRPVPTLLDGLVVDSRGQTVSGLNVSLPEAGRQDVTDPNGVFDFGFGTKDRRIDGGRQRVILNAGASDRRYGTIETFLFLENGRLNSGRVLAVPWLDPSEPFRQLVGGQRTTGLGGGELDLDLTSATIVYPEGVTAGQIHTQAMSSGEYPAPADRAWMPLFSWVFSPGGVRVDGSVEVEFTMPRLGNGTNDYAAALPKYVILLALDPSSLRLAPYGVGELDPATRRVKSVGPFFPARLDFIALSAAGGEATQEMLGRYAEGEVSLDQLRAALAAGRVPVPTGGGAP